MQNYNNEDIHFEDFKNRQDDFEYLATKFSEGNNCLKNALLSSWKNNIQTVACCVGHKERCDEDGMIKILCVDFDTKEIVERKVLFEDSFSSYISFKIRKEDVSLLSKLYTAIDNKYLDKVSLQLSVHPHGFLIMNIHIAESVKNDCFEFISNFYEVNNNYQESELFSFFVSLEENAKDNNDYYDEITMQEKMMINPLTYFYKKGNRTLMFFGEEINEENIIGVIRDNVEYLKYISDSNSNIPDCFIEYIIGSILKKDINAFKYINKTIDDLTYARICMTAARQDSRVLTMIDKDKLTANGRDYYSEISSVVMEEKSKKM